MSDLEDPDYEIQDGDFENQYEESDVRDHISSFPPHESFDVSSFTQSKNGPDVLTRHIKGNFPISNAPTLQVSPEPKLDFLGKKNNKKSKAEISKNHLDSSGNHKKIQLQEEIDILRAKLAQKQKRQDSFISKIQELNNTNLQLQKLIREKDSTIRQKQQLLLIQDKKYKDLMQSASKSIPTSSKQKPKAQISYIQQFCPQFLSPEQSLELFSQLIIKIDKSTSIKKKILKDRKIIGILGQFLKSQ